MTQRRIGPHIALVAVTVLLVSAAGPALATNGMYLTSYGAESSGRAGANLAISDRSLAINFNPAGITQLQGRHYSADIALLVPSLTFDNFNNSSVEGETAIFPLPSVTYVRSDGRSPWSFGLGFIAQGGMGADFRQINTFLGNRDDIFSEVRFMTLVPTVAYAVNEDMSFGAALNVGWGDVAFEFYPETSFFNQQMPEASFFGLDMDPAGGLQTNLRLGWWWRANPRLSVGAIYQTETESNFEDGDMVVNFTGHPFLQQKVGYSADVEGFTFAAQAGVGFAVRASDSVILALDVKRYFWDDAIDTITVTATDPDVQGAPPEVVVPFVFNWEDQWIVALGLDVRATDRLTWRLGYNHGENPVPDDTLNPLFPATVEDHVAAGFSWLFGNKTFNMALEHGFEADATNLNANQQVNPFGPGSRVQHDQWTLSFGISWALDRK